MTDAEREALIEMMARAMNPECFEQDVVATYGDLWALRQQEKQRHLASAALAVSLPIIRKDALEDAACHFEDIESSWAAERLRKLSEAE